MPTAAGKGHSEEHICEGTIGKVELERKDHTIFYDAKLHADGTKLSVRVQQGVKSSGKKEKKEK